VHNDKKIVLHPMSLEAILRDEHARASKIRNHEHVGSENQNIANQLEKNEKSNKSDHHTKTVIKLTGSCYLATKSDLNEIDASITICYALVCKETLFSIEDIQPLCCSRAFSSKERWVMAHVWIVEQ
jgi:hypothetical protein